LNIPLSQLERRLGELPPDREVVAQPWPVVRPVVRGRRGASTARLSRAAVRRRLSRMENCRADSRFGNTLKYAIGALALLALLELIASQCSF
jgi:hypothetical protein